MGEEVGEEVGVEKEEEEGEEETDKEKVEEEVVRRIEGVAVEDTNPWSIIPESDPRSFNLLSSSTKSCITLLTDSVAFS